MFRIAINKLFEWLFSRVLTCHFSPWMTGFDFWPGHVSPWTYSLGCRRPWSSLFTVVTPRWSVLFDSEYVGLASADILAAGRCFKDALQVLFSLPYIVVQFMCACTVCSCNSMHWGEPCREHSPLVAHTYLYVPMGMLPLENARDSILIEIK